MTTITIKTTDDAIQFFELLKAGCYQRRIAWWLNDALNEFPSTEARAAAARALDKAMRIDLLMDQNLDVALAPQGGVRLDMNTADETPARTGTVSAAVTCSSGAASLFCGLLLCAGAEGVVAAAVLGLSDGKSSRGSGNVSQSCAPSVRPLSPLVSVSSSASIAWVWLLGAGETSLRSAVVGDLSGDFQNLWAGSCSGTESRRGTKIFESLTSRCRRVELG
jgi:hypothetical protein